MEILLSSRDAVADLPFNNSIGSGDVFRSEPMTPCAHAEPKTDTREPSAAPNGLPMDFAALTESLVASLTSLFERFGAALQTQLTKIAELVKASAPPATPNAALPAGGNFLWKPKAEKDGKLVILLPKALGRVPSVRILSPDRSTELAKGKFSGIANGDRAHYRFKSPGSVFPDRAVVEITKNDGAKVVVEIPNTAARFKY